MLKNQCRNLRFLVLSFRGEEQQRSDSLACSLWRRYWDDAHPSVCFLRTVLCSVNFEEPQADKWRISAFNKLTGARIWAANEAKTRRCGSKCGGAAAGRQGEHRCCLPQVESTEEGQMFPDWRWTCMFSAGQVTSATYGGNILTPLGYRLYVRCSKSLNSDLGCNRCKCVMLLFSGMCISVRWSDSGIKGRLEPVFNSEDFVLSLFSISCDNNFHMKDWLGPVFSSGGL